MQATRSDPRSNATANEVRPVSTKPLTLGTESARRKVLLTLKKYSYLIAMVPLALPPLLLAAGHATGWVNLFAWGVPVVVFGIIPILDLLLGKDALNPDEEADTPRMNSEIFYKFITLGWVAAFAVLLVAVSWAAAASFKEPRVLAVIWVLALGILAMTQGMASALWGAFWPTVYGTRHLGSVRSLQVAIMVLSTAIGPGITGVLIDLGVPFPDQGVVLGLWCLVLSGALVFISRRITTELTTPTASTT